METIVLYAEGPSVIDEVSRCFQVGQLASQKQNLVAS